MREWTSNEIQGAESLYCHRASCVSGRRERHTHTHTPPLFLFHPFPSFPVSFVKSSPPTYPKAKEPDSIINSNLTLKSGPQFSQRSRKRPAGEQSASWGHESPARGGI